MDSTLIVVPLLARPHRVSPLVASIAAATPEPHRVLMVCTPGDHEVIENVAGCGADWFVMPNRYDYGDYARKINAAYHRSTEPFLFLGADDLKFHPGWLTAALERMADRAVGVVGTNDLGSPRVIAGEHATHNLVRRSYVEDHGTIDEPGKVLYEGYRHEFVDDELVETARFRGAWKFAADSLVEHLHPGWGKAPMDQLYAQQGQRMRHSRKLYNIRRQMWQT